MKTVDIIDVVSHRFEVVEEWQKIAGIPVLLYKVVEHFNSWVSDPIRDDNSFYSVTLASMHGMKLGQENLDFEIERLKSQFGSKWFNQKAISQLEKAKGFYSPELVSLDHEYKQITEVLKLDKMLYFVHEETLEYVEGKIFEAWIWEYEGNMELNYGVRLSNPIVALEDYSSDTLKVSGDLQTCSVLHIGERPYRVFKSRPAATDFVEAKIVERVKVANQNLSSINSRMMVIIND